MVFCARCDSVLTSRIYKNAVQRSASGGVFPGTLVSNSILQCKIPPFGAKSFHPSVNLPGEQMSYQSTYEQQRRAAWEQAPKRCPHCRAAINQQFSEYSNDPPRQHCGGTNCRKAASRAGIAERKRQERSAARARLLVYCEQHLDRDQKQAVMTMCDMLMQFSHDEGHQIAEDVVKVIKAQSCKHDRIAQLEQNAAIWKRRALKSEEQLNARIAELEEELKIFNT